MTCMASANREGVLGSERVCLCTEGFGNRMCSLENVSDRVIQFTLTSNCYFSILVGEFFFLGIYYVFKSTLFSSVRDIIHFRIFHRI